MSSGTRLCVLVAQGKEQLQQLLRNPCGVYGRNAKEKTSGAESLLALRVWQMSQGASRWHQRALGSGPVGLDLFQNGSYSDLCSGIQSRVVKLSSCCGCR